MKPPDQLSSVLNGANRNQSDRTAAVQLPAVRVRAFELDALRGLAVIMMILHHFIYDLRYLLDLDVFAFQEQWWFDALLRPVFLFVFLVVSGICSTFSRSNARRGLRMTLAALLFTLATTAVWLITGMELAIFFNILHLLALGTLIYAGLEKFCGRHQKVFDFVLLFTGAVLLWAGSILNQIPEPDGYWLLPLGILPPGNVGMGDYMPIIPWLGFFLVGALIGRLFYKSGSSLFTAPPFWLKQAAAPFAWTGKRALLIYIIHQPLLLVILYGLRALSII